MILIMVVVAGPGEPGRSGRLRRLFLRIRVRRAVRPGGGYDAFISYSHAADRRLASALQRGLHRFTKPWYRVRAVRVFRDESSLAANPRLWTSIEQALDASKYFILLASPAAAASPWVGRETEHWCATKAIDRLLVVLTDGEITWDEDTGDFAWDVSDALPGSLRGAFAEEPHYIDLRWARTSDELSLRGPLFLDAVADLAAPLHGRAKDELHGEDVRQHRRTRSVARAAAATLVILLAAAAVAAVIAFDQRATAREQRDRAEHQARLALSRQLAAEAVAAGDDQLDLALLLAAQSYATMPTPEARTSLLQVLLRSPHFVGIVPGTAGATQVAFAPHGQLLAIGRSDGLIALWSPERRRVIQSFGSARRAAVTSLAFSDDGRRLASGRMDGSLAVWDTATGRSVAEVSAGTHRVTSVALDRSGGFVAAAVASGRVAIWTTERGRVLHVFRVRPPFFPPWHVAILGNGTIAAGDTEGRLMLWEIRSGALLRVFPEIPGISLIGPPNVYAYSRDLRQFAGLWLGRPEVRTPDVFSVTRPGRGRLLEGPAAEVDAMAFNRDGLMIATAAEGRVTLWSIRQRRALDVALGGVPGRASAVAISPDVRFVAAAARRGVALWEPRKLALMHTLRTRGSFFGEVAPALQGGASAAFSRDGRLLAWSVDSANGSWDVVWRVAGAKEVLRVKDGPVVGFSPDGKELAVGGENDFGIVNLDTRKRRHVRKLPWAASKAAESPTWPQPRIVDGGHGLAASASIDGTITLWDTRRNQSIATLRAPGVVQRPLLVFDGAGTKLAIATVSGAMTIVDLVVQSWRVDACRLAARPLTATEWRLFVGTRRRDSTVCPS